MADVPTEALVAAAFKDLCAKIKVFKENPTAVTEVNGYRAATRRINYENKTHGHVGRVRLRL